MRREKMWRRKKGKERTKEIKRKGRRINAK